MSQVILKLRPTSLQPQRNLRAEENFPRSFQRFASFNKCINYSVSRKVFLLGISQFLLLLVVIACFRKVDEKFSPLKCFSFISRYAIVINSHEEVRKNKTRACANLLCVCSPEQWTTWLKFVEGPSGRLMWITNFRVMLSSPRAEWKFPEQRRL